MSDTKDDGKTLEMDSLVREASDTPAPVKVRRNTRRTPRKKVEASDMVVYEGVDAQKKAARVPRARKADAADAQPAASAPVAAPAPVVVQKPVAAPRPVVELSDEVVGPRAVAVPRKAAPELEVPARYSTDDDDAPSGSGKGLTGRDEGASADGAAPGRLAMERRKERRMARMGDDAGRGPDDRAERDERPAADERRNDYSDSRDDDSREDSSRGSDSRDDDSRGSDSRDDDSSRDDSGDSDDSADSDDSGDSREESEGKPSGAETPRQGDERPRYDRGGGGYANHGQQGGGYNDRRSNKKQKFKQQQQKKKLPGQGGYQGGGQSGGSQGASPGGQNAQSPQRQPYVGGSHGLQNQPQRRVNNNRSDYYGREESVTIEIGDLQEWELLRDVEAMKAVAAEHQAGGEPLDLCDLLTMNLHVLIGRAKDEFKIPVDGLPVRHQLVEQVLHAAWEAGRAVMAEGIVETTPDGYGLLVYQHENYRVRPLCAFVPRVTMRRFGLKRGHIVKAQIQPPRKALSMDGNKENCPAVLLVESIMGRDPMENLQVTPFEDLTPYYPTERLILETSPDVKWDNVSMRVVDLLTPVGKGQRGLIVAPPRTGKTILQQGIANAVMANNPETHLIILLVDERPEEVTDFRRQITRGEVIASTFDEAAESHVHAAEMVIEKARRMVEVGRHVIILLDSITRLGRAYNVLAGNSGKILSGGVEATALQKPKRFFGSARNIEGGGSLTILGTALVETGSRMDEVIFEEFKGTGNMELSLDRAMVDKRIFPAINLEKSGTRKEELLYHPEELIKVYGLRRAMKGVPSPDAMEMLITRVKKTKTNIEFLMGLNR
ncbi:MAG: transcription termination factor Rho [Opitutales bacterium]|jgi:transcription termination factor Rho